MIGRDYPLLKIIEPEVSEIILPRRNIIKAIESAPLTELLYITAPYGCGKTMAVISWLRNQKLDAAWVSICKGDITTEIVCQLISCAILRYAGEQENVDSILQCSYSKENALSLLSEVLVRVSPTLMNMTLVIDNCHILRNTEVLHDIREIIYNMLGCWRIIFIGRGELPPIFNDLILKKCLRQITLNELKFSQDEISDYFQMNGRAVVSKDLIRINEETDGWPSALNAILVAPHNGITEYNFTARSYIMGYFETEIWNLLDDATKEFLLKTAIVDKLTLSICHYLTGVKESNLILSSLYTNGIFITKLEEFNTYCYQRVFKEFLLYKLALSGIDINEMYVKVGWWLYEQDESIAALLCFYKAKNICGINQAFKKVRPDNIGMDKYVEICSCLMKLNIDELKEYPEVAVRVALLFFITNNIEEMKRIYHIVIDWFKPGVLSISPESYVDFSWEVGWLRYLYPDEGIFFNGEFEKWANITEVAPHLLACDRSRASALRLPSVLRGGRDYSVDVSNTEKYYQTICGTNSIRDIDALFVMDLIIAEIAYEREDFIKAEELINRNIFEIERAKQTELYFVCTVLLVKILRATNKQREISKLIERLGSAIENNGHHYLMPNFHAYELRNFLINGKTGTTDVFEKENKPFEDKTYFYLIYRKITFVRALISEDKYIEANLILDNLDLMCRRYNRNVDLIEINILRAISEHGLGHDSMACERIKDALTAGRKCGFVRIFSDDAILVWPVLNLLNKNDIDDYVERIIKSCKKILPCAATNINVNAMLTKAESEVYKLLLTPMSYQEIAKKRNVKPSTINSQVSSIYSKLDVKNRASAVALAVK